MCVVNAAAIYSMISTCDITDMQSGIAQTWQLSHCNPIMMCAGCTHA